MKKILNFFLRSTNKNTLSKKITDKDIKDAYTKRKKEIESLLEYDKGNKTINAPDLQNIM